MGGARAQVVEETDRILSGTHKWLFGPRGTGIIWARRDVWDRIAAVIPTFSGPSFGNWFDDGNAPFVFGLDGTPGGFHSFEHRWALTDAFEFHQAIGKDRVAARTAELATRLKDGVAELPNTRPRPVLGDRLLRCRFPSAGRGGAGAAVHPQDRRDRHPLPGSLRAVRPVHRHEYRAGRRGGPGPRILDVAMVSYSVGMVLARGTTATGSRTRLISRAETPPRSTLRAGP